MKLVFGLFKVNTTTTQNLPPDTRVKNVAAAIERTKQYTDEQEARDAKAGPGDIRAIFLAPEYCFARSLPQGNGDHSFGQKRQIEEDFVKNQLRPIFGSLSKAFKDALIVPGTVAWRKSLRPSDAVNGESPEEIEARRRKKYEQRIKSAKDITMSMDDSRPFTMNTPVYPPQFKYNEDQAMLTPGSKAAAVKVAHYIAKNTAHCYYNGDCIYKYNKIGDYNEVFENTNDTVMVPNRSTVSGTTAGPGRFSASGFDFGISICYDQSLSCQSGNGTARVVEPLQKTAAPVDMHILLSASIPPASHLANLKPGGFLLSCSSDENCNKVMNAKGDEV